MLALDRDVGERILIEMANGERIVLRVVSSSYKRVRLSFDATKEVSVVREELLPDGWEKMPSPVRSSKRKKSA